MSAAHRRWIRLDADWEESPWLHELAGESAGCWPRLLCWVKLRGQRGRCRWPSSAVLAHGWRVPRSVVENLMAAALGHGAITRDGDDLVVAKWEEFQEPDRTAAERMRKMRAKDADVTAGYGVTARNPSRDRDVDVDRDRDKKKPTPKKHASYSPEFEDVWRVHPRGPKAKASEEYGRAIPERLDHEKLVACLECYVATEINERFRGHDLFRWIRDDRWEEYADRPRVSASSVRLHKSVDETAEYLRRAGIAS